MKYCRRFFGLNLRMKCYRMKVKGFRILHLNKPSAIPFRKGDKRTLLPTYIGKQVGPAPCGWCKEGPAQWPVKSREFMILDFFKLKKEQDNVSRFFATLTCKNPITELDTFFTIYTS